MQFFIVKCDFTCIIEANVCVFEVAFYANYTAYTDFA